MNSRMTNHTHCPHCGFDTLVAYPKIGSIFEGFVTCTTCLSYTDCEPTPAASVISHMNDDRERYREALDKASMALAVARGNPHDDSCGEDLCGMCLIETTYEEVIAALRPDLSDEERASLLAHAEYQPPTEPPR
jgi:uncharacterized Zn finger protein (UPF0148 family)